VVVEDTVEVVMVVEGIVLTVETMVVTPVEAVVVVETGRLDFNRL
jgi:hypothetical protein